MGDDASTVKLASEVGGASLETEGSAKQRRLPAAGWAPLHLLLARGNQEGAVRQLISWRADSCKRGGVDRMTPLMLAISLSQEAVALLLLSTPEVAECVDVQDSRGRSALHFAV